MPDPVVRIRPRIFARVKEKADAQGVTLKEWVEKVLLVELAKPESLTPEARPRWPVVRK